MQHDHFCVAGFDVHACKMVRPLRRSGDNWVFDEWQPAFRAGQLVDAKASAPRRYGLHPHILEDLMVLEGMVELESWTGAELFRAMQRSAFEAIAQMLDRRPLENRYVVEGTQCRSLGGVRTVPSRVSFLPHGHDRLWLQFDDADGEPYRLPVTCDRLRALLDPRDGSPGVEGANAWLRAMPPDAPLVLRIGLGRGYAGADGEYDPKRCYLQVNGILSERPLPDRELLASHPAGRD